MQSNTFTPLHQQACNDTASNLPSLNVTSGNQPNAYYNSATHENFYQQNFTNVGCINTEEDQQADVNWLQQTEADAYLYRNNQTMTIMASNPTSHISTRSSTETTAVFEKDDAKQAGSSKNNLGTEVNNGVSRKDQDETRKRRLAANKRERKRVEVLNSKYEELANIAERFIGKKPESKIKTLESAKQIIEALEKLLNSSSQNFSGSANQNSIPGTSQMLPTALSNDAPRSHINKMKQRSSYHPQPYQRNPPLFRSNQNPTGFFRPPSTQPQQQVQPSNHVMNGPSSSQLPYIQQSHIQHPNQSNYILMEEAPYNPQQQIAFSHGDVTSSMNSTPWNPSYTNNF